MLDLSRDAGSRFTFHPAWDGSALWSPDGSTIVFASNREGVFNLYKKPVGGAGGQEELLLKSESGKFPDDWSADGKLILYETETPRTRLDVWMLPWSSDRQPTPVLQSEASEMQSRLSPDGRWLAYASDESGRYEVYVQTFPPSGGKWQISTGGGTQPTWPRDIGELYFLAPDQKLMAVTVKAAESFEAGPPAALFDTRIPTMIDIRNQYVPASDGERFLVQSPVRDSAAPVHIFLNWPAALPR